MSIVIVEDDARISSFLERGLKSEGYLVQTCSDGAEAVDFILKAVPEVVILDRMLPNLDGIEVCNRLRARGVTARILMLSALNEVNERVLGLSCGADDYLGKPFAFEELLARIKILHQRGSVGNREDTVTLGDLVYDRASLQLKRAGQLIHLTDKESGILELLISHPGKVFSRERILSAVWGVNSDPLTNVVDVYIRRLRKKIDEGRETGYLQTVRGRGYSINPAD